MKLWVWFAVAVVWLVIPQVMIHNGGLTVTVMTGEGISEKVAFALSAFLMNLILWGWLIPLSIGLLRLVQSKRIPVAPK